MGGSSNVCARLKPGEPVVLMGPTGHATEIVRNQTVMLVGGGLGNAVLFSIGKALRAAGSHVLYFAGYRKAIDLFKREEIEAASDVVVWCCEESPGIEPQRPQDLMFEGNVVEGMKTHANNALIPLNSIDHMLVIGSDRMMTAVNRARKTLLKPTCKAIASINSPMQCMMKGVCAQCLQIHINPQTGEETTVFSCKNQDQPMDWVDFSVLTARLQQNSVSEKLCRLMIER